MWKTRRSWYNAAMRIIEFVPPRPHRLWALCRQMGITDVVVKAAPELTGRPAPWQRDALAGVVGDLAAAGLRVVALEGDPFDMAPIKLGLPNRDEALEQGGKISLFALLRCRVRHFSHGVAVGPLEFIRTIARSLNPQKDTWSACECCDAIHLCTARPLRGDDKVSVPRRNAI